MESQGVKPPRLEALYVAAKQAAENGGRSSFRAPILREESLFVFCFDRREILRFAQNDDQRTFPASCKAATHKAVLPSGFAKRLRETVCEAFWEQSLKDVYERKLLLSDVMWVRCISHQLPIPSH